MDILNARYVPPDFDAWDAQFARLWRCTDMMKMPGLISRRFYFDRGYTPVAAVNCCTDVDPTMGAA